MTHRPHDEPTMPRNGGDPQNAKTWARDPVVDRASDSSFQWLRDAVGQGDGDWIGSFRILDRINGGGMGEVFLAVRQYDGGFQKRFALKVLHAGLEEDEDLHTRFRTEGRILSFLDHPNIARFLDAGLTDEGSPYFVMELVEGLRIDHYCERQGLSLAKRIRLFQAVCEAVQFAHKNLVIHSDLKPDNILVTAEGAPKLLDFGIATLLNPELFAPGARPSRCPLMTPRYASPEQVRGGLITTATDVYSLGVLLYELLTGLRPYLVEGRSRIELEREICEQLPLKPSDALERRAQLASRLGAFGVDGDAPWRGRWGPRHLDGDLDAILLKALEKESDQRYGSVQELAEDLQRFLDRRPVQARPATPLYHGTRCVQRHPVVAAVCLGLTVGGLGLYVGSRRRCRQVEQERDEAASLGEAARDQARESAKEARYIQQLVAEFFRQKPRGRSWQFLAFVEARLAEDLVDMPATHANLLETLGLIYQQMGNFAKAESLFEEALELRCGAAGPPNPELSQSFLVLSNLRLLRARASDEGDGGSGPEGSGTAESCWLAG